MCCEKDSKKEWEKKNNIKIAIIGGPIKKQTLVERFEEFCKQDVQIDIQENEQEER